MRKAEVVKKQKSSNCSHVHYSKYEQIRFVQTNGSHSDTVFADTVNALTFLPLSSLDIHVEARKQCYYTHRKMVPGGGTGENFL